MVENLSVTEDNVDSPATRIDEYPVEFHAKGWGHESWLANSPLYCGKLLFFKKGLRCSFHYHKLKTETFYLQSGKLLIKFSNIDDLQTAQSRIMLPGENMQIFPGLRHQMIALEDSELFEFSTQHFEDDSYRVVRGD